jgi:acyl carrier protein
VRHREVVIPTIEEQVVDYVRSSAGQWAKDASSESRLDQLGIDSFGLFELLLGLEERFGISIKVEDFSIATFRTVQNMIEYVTHEFSDGTAG